MSIADEVQALHAHAYPRLFKPSLDRGAAELEILRCIATPTETLLVAEMDREVVGYARVERQERDGGTARFARTQLYVHELGVREGAQRLGVGTALLRHVQRTARAAGIARIGVDVWMKNGPARAFYDAVGFAPEREERWFTAPGAVGGLDDPVL